VTGSSSSLLLRKLEGGDRRSIGGSGLVVAEVLADPALFDELFSGLRSLDPVVRIRTADALEKVTATRPDLLRPYKRDLLGPFSESADKEIRWHVAQMLPRVRWSRRERSLVYEILRAYLRDSSSIVKTCAMQALVDLTAQAPDLRSPVLRLVRRLTTSGTPAMRARGRRLLTAPARVRS